MKCHLISICSEVNSIDILNDKNLNRKTLNSEVWGIKKRWIFEFFHSIIKHSSKSYFHWLLFKPTKRQWNPPVILRSHNDNNNNNNRAFLPFAVAGIPIDLLWFCCNICSVKLSIENVMMNKRDERKGENNEERRKKNSDQT